MDKFVILFVIALYGASNSNVEGASRIIGGTEETVFRLRYVVSLQERSQEEHYHRGHRCGGALITYSHAVTAASCVYNNNSGQFSLINPAQYRLFTGAVSLTDDNLARPYRIRQISSITPHPEYAPTRRFVNDIAVILASSPFSDTTVRPLQLPNVDVTETNLAVCYSAGWGAQNATATASTQLMSRINRVTQNAYCSINFNQAGTSITMLSSMLCARPATVETSGCAGDLGNPLVCDDRLVGTLFLTKNCSATQEPEAYTRIFTYRTWLNEITVGVPTTDGASTYQPCIGLLAMFALAQIITSMS